jgi:ferrous iron transport protein B
MTSCHAPSQPLTLTGGRIALVGNPNVGKSVLFHRLTGQYAVVSNYPGTTVEITQGKATALPGVVILDTPGIVSFPARSEDEAVTASVLLRDPIQVVMQVGDAKNLRRTLHLTVQLAEMGLPQTLALNMVDEARARGLLLDLDPLVQALGVPVTATIATRGVGIEDLTAALQFATVSNLKITYPADIEQALAETAAHLPAARIAARALALLWLSGDNVAAEWLHEQTVPDAFAELLKIREHASAGTQTSPVERIRAARETYVEELAQRALHAGGADKLSFSVRLGHMTTHPIWGLPILLLALAGLYWFVGILGAGTLVGLLEKQLFREIVNPWVTNLVNQIIPIHFFADLLVGEYGLWTMGATYAIALLLPIVVTFFIAFGVLEDSGYLPRMAVLANRIFSWMGLNGQAILPMVLGLGCVTMATMTTRILTSRRDRILVTILLALAVPCSAQLGVVMGMLANISLSATLIWAGMILLILLAVGRLAAQVMPGARAPLVIELPPLRLPVLSNVLVKTAARLEWYIKEAVPLFLLGTLLLFALDQLHILPILIRAAEPLVTGWLGLPPEAATSFLLGLMRRDFAATGLFHMQQHGLLTPIQSVVSIVTITLFIPCIASMFMIIKERGPKMGAAMIVFIFPFAMLVGGLLYRLLLFLNWNG